MNIKNINKIKNLNESQKLQQNVQNIQNVQNNDINSQKLQDVFEIKTNQFKFSNGVIIGNVFSGINNPFGLSYWVKKSNSFENFIELVQKAMDFELTQTDISKLKSEYNKIA